MPRTRGKSKFFAIWRNASEIAYRFAPTVVTRVKTFQCLISGEYFIVDCFYLFSTERLVCYHQYHVNWTRGEIRLHNFFGENPHTIEIRWRLRKLTFYHEIAEIFVSQPFFVDFRFRWRKFVYIRGEKANLRFLWRLTYVTRYTRVIVSVHSRNGGKLETAYDVFFSGKRLAWVPVVSWVRHRKQM